MKTSGAAGALSVFIGAVSYGMPGVILSLATASNAKIESLIPTQFLFSFVLFFILSERIGKNTGVFYFRDKVIVLATGIPLLCITYCFFNAVYYIGVPTSTLLMMQSAWIAPLLNALIKKRALSRGEIVRFVFIMAGVVTATGVFRGEMHLDPKGIMWGLAAGMSYSLVIVSSSNIANGVRIIDKAKILTFGAFIASLFLFNKNIDIAPVSESSMWSVLNAVFSSILPVLLYGFGMPRTDSSLAGMLVTTELPAAFIFSYLLLSDSITADQIAGCAIIIMSIAGPMILSGLRRRQSSTKCY
ncbi:drug/metabolite transporter (DMT)-like permease [Enterobacter sp. BIGb0383]|uniref:DMT family transporter n=1 Tax=unclassified Enterobacter TaxID=2608935 RepID=UPI000F4668FB|nr:MULTISPECIES: DMT family transporter [unclassified Enterobacter]ROP61704.1 drug/metabolite transporter (DMT)-like permease [Enterobacter sp. BIGb0383]ROS11865.1 drug/metabolite transporter (DMT)-like permease [Enterobacter sp. BIGb0359]